MRAVVPRGMRTYVSVYLQIGPDGHEAPQVVVLPDGRMFRIDAVERWQRVQGGYALTVRIGSHVTTLWKDTGGWSGPRWYVIMRRPVKTAACRGGAVPAGTVPGA